MNKKDFLIIGTLVLTQISLAFHTCETMVYQLCLLLFVIVLKVSNLTRYLI